ncbi:hypothetical protein A0H81_10563 [Grifola frondosa]|uniref:Uncharacterized protein n=1 Tax=Grifola frondosa TaxID=5627 RepID=A0A1C7LZW4_GRIFR|nr:hypothetical protein A0H81_10563 [Grifola frondosa]
MSTNKRTRSQLTLSDFNFSKLAHSPFKHARTTLRSHSSQPASSDISVEDIGAYNRMRGGTVDGDGDDGSSEMILAPRTESKRPSSPLEDSVPLPTRELKRPKHDHHIQPNLLRKPTSASAPARRSGPSTNKKTSATLCAAPRLTRSSSFSFAQPTASSAAKGSSAKPHSIAASSGIGIHSTAPYASRPSSSLSMLSLALEKLNVPPPIRPNTSMGFHRDTVKGDSDDEGDTSESTGNADRTVRYGKGKTNGGRDNSPHASGPFSGAHPRAILLQRSATVGDLSGKFTTPSSSKTTPRQSTLMLPPPLPSIAKPGVTVSSRRIIGASGQVKPTFTVGHGRVQHPTGSARAKIFAVGAGAAMHNRVFQRVSQKSSLPTVQGSPVKGGSRGEDLSEPDMVSGTEVGGSIETGERDDGLSSWSSAAPTFTPGATLPQSRWKMATAQMENHQ